MLSNPEDARELTSQEQEVLQLLDSPDGSAQAREVYRRHAGVRPAATLYWVRGGHTSESGRLREAAEDYFRSARLLVEGGDHADSPERGWLRTKALGRAGECLFADGEYEDAYRAFREAIDELGAWLKDKSGHERRDKQEPFAWLHGMASEAAREAGQTQEALDLAVEARQLDPENASWFVSEGLALSDLERPADAIAAFDRAIKMNPNLNAVHAYRANALAELGNLKDSLAAAREFAVRRPDDPAGLLGVGDALLRIGELNEARRVLADFVRSFPDRTTALLDRVDKLEGTAPDQAVALLDAVLEVAPNETRALRSRGMIKLYDFDDYEGALQDFQTALTQGEREGLVDADRLLYLKAETLWALDRFEAAIPEYLAALNREREEFFKVEILLRLAECYDAIGNLEECQRYVKKFWPHRELFMKETGDEERLEWARNRLEKS